MGFNYVYSWDWAAANWVRWQSSQQQQQQQQSKKAGKSSELSSKTSKPSRTPRVIWAKTNRYVNESLATEVDCTQYRSMCVCVWCVARVCGWNWNCVIVGDSWIFKRHIWSHFSRCSLIRRSQRKNEENVAIIAGSFAVRRFLFRFWGTEQVPSLCTYTHTRTHTVAVGRPRMDMDMDMARLDKRRAWKREEFSLFRTCICWISVGLLPRCISPALGYAR